MSVILTILKVIGIILLVILGILLTVILLVLFVPFRYRVHIIRHDDIFKVEGRITWLLHLLRTDILYNEKHGTAVLKIFGFRVKQFHFPKGAETEETSAVGSGDSADGNVNTAGDNVNPANGNADSAGDNVNSANGSGDSGRTAWQETIAETTEETGSSAGEASYASTDAGKQGQALRDGGGVSEKASASKTSFFRRKRKKTADTATGSKGLAGRLLDIVVKLADLAIRLLMKIPYLPAEVYDKLDSIEHKLAEKYDYVTSRMDLLLSIEAEHMLGKAVRYILYLLRGYAPRKISGYIHFGAYSPDVTGKLAGLIFVLIPAAGDEYEVNPDFYETVLETDTTICGVIRTYRMAWIAIRLLTDKEFWTLFRRVRNKDKNIPDKGGMRKKRKNFLKKKNRKKAA